MPAKGKDKGKGNKKPEGDNQYDENMMHEILKGKV